MLSRITWGYARVRGLLEFQMHPRPGGGSPATNRKEARLKIETGPWRLGQRTGTTFAVMIRWRGVWRAIGA